VTKGDGVKTTSEMKWSTNFGPKMTSQFTEAQTYIDSTVLRFCSKYLPFDTGMLEKSGILGTEIGSGEVRWLAPYAPRLYYNPQFDFQGAPMRGGKWFERMKADNKDEIVRNTKRIGGGDG